MILNLDTKKDRVAAQLRLKELGFNPGPIDGIWGDKSEAAYERYLGELDVPMIVPPKAVTPWFKSRRGKGLFTLLIGLAVFFIPGAESIDTGQAVNIIWDNIDNVSIIIEKVGALIAAGGMLWSIVGAKNATAAIDPNLVAKIGTREIRLPKRIYTSPEEVNEKSFVDRARGWFGET